MWLLSFRGPSHCASRQPAVRRRQPQPTCRYRRLPQPTHAAHVSRHAATYRGTPQVFDMIISQSAAESHLQSSIPPKIKASPAFEADFQPFLREYARGRCRDMHTAELRPLTHCVTEFLRQMQINAPIRRIHSHGTPFSLRAALALMQPLLAFDFHRLP